jgi:hypothetical protein
MKEGGQLLNATGRVMPHFLFDTQHSTPNTQYHEAARRSPQAHGIVETRFETC